MKKKYMSPSFEVENVETKDIMSESFEYGEGYAGDLDDSPIKEPQNSKNIFF